MNENVPSLDEIMMAWNEKCQGLNCEDCKLKNDAFRHSCKARYTHAILTGDMTLTDSFKKEEPKPEPELPAWCKEGRWVTESHTAHSLGVIDGVFVGGRIGVTWKHHKDRVVGCSTPAHTVKPVRFREPTIDEAKTFLGKVMEYYWEGRDPVAAIITIVSLDSSDIRYNGLSFEELQDWNATIDGIPVGMPEVDEALLKGGRE